MTAHKLDTAVFDEERPVDARALQSLADSARAAHDQHLPRAAWVFDYRTPPRMVCLEWGVVCLPLFLPRGASEVTVRLRHQVGVDGGSTSVAFTHGLALRRFGDNDRAISADEIKGRVEVTAGGGVVTTTLTLDALEAFVEGGPAQLFLCGLSEADEAARDVIEDGSGTVDGHFERWEGYGPVFAAASSQFEDSIPAARVDFQRYDTGAGAYVDAPELPRPAQVLRAWDGGSPFTATFQLFISPPPGSTGVAQNTTGAGTYRDEVAWTPLTWSELYSVEVRVSAVNARAGYGTALNATADPDAMTLSESYAITRDVFLRRGRWHRVGASGNVEDATQQDDTAPAMAEVSAGRWQGARSVAAAPVNLLGYDLDVKGAGATYSDPSDVGTWGPTAWGTAYVDAGYTLWPSAATYQRTALGALALVAASGYERGVSFELRARLRWYHSGGNSGGETVTTTARAAAYTRADHAAQEAAYLLALYDEFSSAGAALRAHALRGVYPARLWHQFQWAALQIEETLDTTNDCRVTLELQQSARPKEGGADIGRAPRRTLHVGALHLYTVATDDPDAIGI
jgi:hypothetical protein